MSRVGPQHRLQVLGGLVGPLLPKADHRQREVGWRKAGGEGEDPSILGLGLLRLPVDGIGAGQRVTQTDVARVLL